MAFYGQFPTTAGPNDPQIPPLTPQQLTFAFQQFQLQQQMQMPAPPQPPHVPRPGPVIDPALLPSEDRTTEDRLHALEREIEALKTQKRSNSDGHEGASKRRKKGSKPSPYKLRTAKGLSKKQMEVRTQLMKKVKSELRHLTGTTDEDDSDESDSNSSTPAASASTLAFDFTANVDDPANVKVIDRAVHLVWTEQHDPKSKTFSLVHADVEFTREDLTEFAKTIFRGRKRTWKAENDPELAKKKADNESKRRQEMRRKELKATRIKAVSAYKKAHKRDPVFILETDWMTDEVSGPDTDDEEKRAAHRRRLVRAARLGPNQQTDAVWERIRPGFQSNELAGIKDTLDEITTKKKKPTRSARVHVSPGSTWATPITASRLEWYDDNVDGNEVLENELQMYTTDPVGFGLQSEALA
ncbi:hypothetical protein FB451DRAFT_1571200 [Mycena latifolia]|nr:hypothetical protein FB451DRAFT_1571200 [Mycena latifolia]